MQRPLQITSPDFTLTPVMESLIREKADGLELYYPRLTGCHVIVRAAVGHHRTGGPFDVRIVLRAPGSELVVNHQDAEDLSIALREAFDAARRKLEDYIREQRRAVKAHEPLPVARVVRILPEDDHGFLLTPDGREIYFHRNAVLSGGFDELEPGTEVRFAEEEGEKGPQASTVAIRGPRRKRRKSRSTGNEAAGG